MTCPLVSRKFYGALVLTLALAALTIAQPAHADYSSAKRRFDSLPSDERISITLGLIATGDFNGLLDFGFTKRFYNAVRAFERREELKPDGELESWESARLHAKANEFYAPLGVISVAHPISGSKILLPRTLFDTEERTGHGFAYERRDKNLSLSFVAYSLSEKSFSEIYMTLASDTDRRKVAYKRLRTGYFVANGTFNERNFYTWMSVVPGGSSGFTLSWSNSWETMGSKLAILLANGFSPVPTSDQSGPPTYLPEPPRQENVSASPTPPPALTSGTGTGFKVSEQGHVLTNFHVAGQCQSITLNKTGELPVGAELVAGDATNDLALVKATSPLAGPVAAFRTGPAIRAGADIVVFGFPLSSQLSASGNIVTGNITSLSGYQNDSRQFQISAPVQPGNSGGPVMDREGRIVAVVVAKLDALAALRDTGDVPQNVNFAIKANVAMNFLDGTGIDYKRQDSGTSLETPDIAELSQGFTYLIECRN